ncbi:MAG: EAL domain-containing protein [Clostridiales bacterium]|jgi:diguanylate cyclase (GGDEF)-like protein/PAS domain S-box-containing protein|nr:EAL domain-containing protein [Clostridiales bacterium]
MTENLKQEMISVDNACFSGADSPDEGVSRKHRRLYEELAAANGLELFQWRPERSNDKRFLRRALSALKRLFFCPARRPFKEQTAGQALPPAAETPRNQAPDEQDDGFYQLVFNMQAVYSYVYIFATKELHMNHGMKKFLGFQSHILKNINEVTQYVYRDDLAELLRFCGSAGKTPSDKISIRVKTPGHSILWVALSESSTYDAKGNEIFRVGTLTDITEQIQAQIKNKMIIEGSSYCVYIIDFKNGESEISSKILEIAPLKVLSGPGVLNAWIDIIMPEERQTFLDSIQAVIDGTNGEHALEYRVRGYDNEPIWVACRGRCTYDEDGKPEYLAGSVIDIRTLGQYNKYLTLLSSVDQLSGMPNRAQLNRDFEKVQPEWPLTGCALLVDVDDFKNINTLFGIHTGDKFIQYLCRHLARKKSKTMRLYHFKVDRFFVMFEETVTEEINGFVEGIKEVTNEGMLIDGKLIKATFSIGGAFFYQGQSVADVIDNAEIAIRKVKASGKNGFEMFSPLDKENYIKKIAMESILLKAVEHNMDGFMPYFQPIYSVEKQKIIGAEALMRWRDQTGRVQSPGLIIPRLQSMGVFHRVERWILHEAAHFCRKWIDMGMAEDFMVNINLTPEQAAKETAKDEILKVLSLNDLTKKNVVVEITEESLVPGIKPGSKMLRELRNSGIRLAIDDFGTGYSSLSYLREMPAYEIKIDRSFIKDIERDDSAKNIVSAIISLSKSMEYIVCVEGVETAGQLEILRGLGADLLQGYYFSLPLPPWLFEERFVKNRTPEYARQTYGSQ